MDTNELNYAFLCIYENNSYLFIMKSYTGYKEMNAKTEENQMVINSNQFGCTIICVHHMYLIMIAYAS